MTRGTSAKGKPPTAGEGWDPAEGRELGIGSRRLLPPRWKSCGCMSRDGICERTATKPIYFTAR